MAGHTILVVVSSNLSKVIKTSILCYMVFKKEHDKSLSYLSFFKEETKEDLEIPKLLREF